MKKQKKAKKRNISSITLENNNDSIKVPNFIRLDKHPVVLSFASKIADLVSNMTIYLMENGEKGDTKIKNNLSKVIDIYPNQNMTRKSLIFKIVMDLILTGNSICYIKFEKGQIKELIPWDINKISFRGTNESYNIYKSGISFAPDEVLHFVLNPDTEECYKGIGYTNIIKESVINLAQAEATKKAFLKDKWKPSLIISTNSDSEELQDEEKREKILGSYVSKTKIGEPWLIPADEISIEKISPLTLKDLAIQESITLDKQTIARDLGLPCYMIGVGNYNEDEYNNFISTTVNFIATVIQQELTKKLAYNDKWYFKFNQKSLIHYNLKAKTDFVISMVQNGIISRNEARNEFDYNLKDDEAMDEILLLENYIPINQSKDQEKLLKGGDNNE